MKAIVCVIVGVAICARSLAQVQELEQLRLDLEKLAQFKMMLSEMKSGYQTLSNGYNAVRDAGKANFNLHQNYLDGLLAVSPQVRNNPSVQRIYSNQQAILGSCKSLLSQARSVQVFSASELNEMVSECNAITQAVSSDAELLLSVLTPGSFRMSDGERSAVIARVDQSVRKQLDKLNALSQDYKKIMVLRLQGKRDIESLKKLGNHN